MQHLPPPDLQDYLSLAAGVLVGALFVVAVLAWRRRPTARTLMVAAAFGMLLVRSVFTALSDFVVAEAIGDILESLAVPLEIAFLLLIAAAAFKA